MATKSAARAAAKARIKAMQPTARAAEAAAVAQRVRQHPAYQRANKIALFISLPDEVATGAIFNMAFGDGKACFVPRYTTDSMDMYRVTSAADIESLPKTKYNVAQPENIAERENATDDGKGLDLILVPGLAFTPAGARLGRGKGYYDQYLQRCLESGIQSTPVTIGIGFKAQLVEELPTESHDMTLDHVICGS